MPVCHKCAHNLQGHAECLSCRGPGEPSHAGKSFVSLSSMDDPAGYLHAHAAEGWRITGAGGGEGVTGLPDGVEDYLRRLLSSFAQMKDGQAVICRRLLAGQTMAEAARGMGVTRQAVYSAVRKMMRQFPEVRALVGIRA